MVKNLFKSKIWLANWVFGSQRHLNELEKMSKYTQFQLNKLIKWHVSDYMAPLTHHQHHQLAVIALDLVFFSKEKQRLSVCFQL